MIAETTVNSKTVVKQTTGLAENKTKMNMLSQSSTSSVI